MYEIDDYLIKNDVNYCCSISYEQLKKYIDFLLEHNVWLDLSDFSSSDD